MQIFLMLIGIAASVGMIKFRERLGDMVGEAEWMNKVGGVYNVIIIVAVLMFFFSLAYGTGTTGIFFSPLKTLLPGMMEEAPVRGNF